MKHDETNLNSARPIDPELEARVVAWVAGEASPFEAAELERRCATEPALADFKRRIEAMHGLVGEATRAPGADWRLAPERRAALLEKLSEGGGATKAGPRRGGASTETGRDDGEGGRLIGLPTGDRRRSGWRAWLVPAAACLALGGLLAGLLVSKTETTFGMTARPGSGAEYEGFGESSKASAKETVQLNERGRRAGASEAPARVEFNLPGQSADVAGGFYSDGQGGAAYDSFRRTPPVAVISAPASPAAPAVRGDLAEAGKMASASSRQGLTEEDRQRAKAAWNKLTGRTGVDGVTITAGDPADFGLRGQLAMDKKQPENETTADWGRLAKRENSAGVAEPAGRRFVDGEVLAFANGVGTGDDYVFRGQTTGAPAIPMEQGGAMPAADKLGSPGLAYGANGLRLASDRSYGVKADYDSGHGYNAALSGAAVGLEKDASVGEVFFEAQTPVLVTGVGTGLAGAKIVAAKDGPADAARAGVGKSMSAAGRIELSQKLLDLPLEKPASSSPGWNDRLRAEVATQAEAVSTFSLHVGDASFRLAKAALERGVAPDPASIRPEEFYNAFDYGDPAPAAGEPVACRIEQAAHPFLQQRTLVRIALRVPAAGRGAGTPLHLTVLLDTSGSMEREDRAATVRAALTSLAALLGPDDRVTLVGFAREPRLLAESLPGDQAGKLAELAARTPAEGGTNLEEALKAAGALARRQWRAGAQNRIVLLTDGAANLGDAEPVRLAEQIEALRRQGVAFDACGVGAEGLDDGVLEALTRKGDGRYQLLNSPEEADAGFARRLAGAFRPAAENVKVQVRFNPARVARYRLIGFERHRLREQDFKDDRVDAAELAAEEAAVALYQVETIPGGEGELGEVAVRFRQPARGEMVERRWTLAYEGQPPAFDRAPASLRLAGAAALLAEKLRGGAPAGLIRLDELAPVVSGLRGAYAGDARVNDFIRMFEQARRLTGE